MLGESIDDPDKVESQQGSVAGLGLLDNQTIFNHDKTTTQVKARVIADDGLLKGLKGIEIAGYEIHMGQTRSQNYLPAFQVMETPQGKANYFDGAIGSSGWIFGTYIHGLFHNTNFTRAFLKRLRQFRGLPMAAAMSINRQEQYDKLAAIVRQNLDMSQVYKITLGRSHG